MRSQGPMQDSIHSSLWGSQRGCSPVRLPRPQCDCRRLYKPSLPLVFPLLPLAFSICGTDYSISSSGLSLLSPPQPPSLFFSLISTSDPHPITPAGSSSPGCETDALDQQGATAQPQPSAGSQLSCPSFPSGELKR